MQNTDGCLLPGTVLYSGIAYYSIVKKLGAGGFGVTYLAETSIRVGNLTHTVNVAIKECYSSQLSWRDADGATVCYSPTKAKEMQQTRNDFISEAKRLQKIGANHPNVVRVNEVFEANNTAYYVMEYLQGENLYHYVKSSHEGKLTIEQTESVIRPIVSAITFLHNNRITHLDIKPDNIMIVRCNNDDSVPVLIDFGLAKHYDEDGRPTSTINILGVSPGYSPIEQYGGIREFSPAADVYALAATILYCLSGRDPKESSVISCEDIDAMIPASISAAARRTLHSCMAPFAKNRPSDITLLNAVWEKTVSEYEMGDVIYDALDEGAQGNPLKETIPCKKKEISYNMPIGDSVAKNPGVRWEEEPHKKARNSLFLGLVVPLGVLALIFVVGAVKLAINGRHSPVEEMTDTATVEIDTVAIVAEIIRNESINLSEDDN